MNATDTPASGPGRAQWTSRSIGSRFGHQVFYLFIRHMGRRGAYFLLYFVALFYVLFTPSVRRTADYYLRRRFGRTNPLLKLTDTYRMFLGLGKALVDRAVIGILGEDRMGMEFEEQRALSDLLKEGKGLILLTAHVGCWQTAMSSMKNLNVPVHVLIQHEEGDVDLHYFEHAGIKCPYGVIDPRGYMGGVLEMMSALKKGEVVSMMGDRVLGGRKGMAEADFLGGKALFPYSAFKIAAATGAPVGILLSHKSGPERYALELAGIIRVPEGAGRQDRNFRPYVAEFVRALESYTTAHPYQFFNFYDLWEAAGHTTNDQERDAG